MINFTILRSCSGQFIGKVFSKPKDDVYLRPHFSTSKDFYHQYKSTSLRGFYKIIKEMKNDQCLALGRVKDQSVAITQKTKETMIDHETSLLLMDIDGWQYDQSLSDHEAIEHYIKKELPSYFHDVSYVVHFNHK